MFHKKVTVALVALISLVVQTTAQSQTYCDPSLCNGRSNVHIGCPGVAVNRCPADVKVVNMATHQATILNTLNGFRNDLASGRISHLPTGARLAQVTWDSELSNLATIHAKQCYFAHDQCRNTKAMPWSGQNLFGSTGVKDPAACIAWALQSWWDEYKVTTSSDIASYPSNTGGRVIGHFTVMANEKSVRIGCGAVQYNNDNNCQVTCNFSLTNILNYPVYGAGATGSRCTSGRSPSYAGLCSASEPIDYSRP